MKTTEAFHVVILGGGPGGISAGLWCAELGMNVVVIEGRAEFGGQLLSIYNPISNYLGLETENGRDLHDRFMQQFEKRDVAVRLGTSVEYVDVGQRTLRLSDGAEFAFRSLVIATGVRRRALNVDGEGRFSGRGILESGAKEHEMTSGKNVVIVGGGDAALENALLLSRHASDVTVIHRRDRFSARREFVNAAESRPNIRFLMNSHLTAIGGNESVDHVIVRDPDREKRIATDFVLIRIGVTPNSELFSGQIECDSRGYLIVDSNCRTSNTCVFAVGDVANPESPTISTAVGMGATAAKSIFKAHET